MCNLYYLLILLNLLSVGNVKSKLRQFSPFRIDTQISIYNTLETGYKVAICPRGNILYMWIYLITDQKLLYMGILGIYSSYFISDFIL